MKVLFFQSDPGLGEGVPEALRRRGYAPAVHTDLDTAAVEFVRQRPFLAVVDGRGDHSGAVALLREIRSAAQEAGSVLLALCDRDGATLQALLEAGADDGLQAPFSPSDLVFRIGVLLHRDGQRRKIWEAGRSRPAGRTPQVSSFTRETTGESLLWFRPDDRTLFERMPVGLYRSTPDGRLLDGNAALVEIMGAPDRATLLSGRTTDRYVDPQDRRRWEERIGREGVLKDSEVRLRRYDGRVIWAKISAQAFTGPDGQVQYYEGSLEDITDRKLAEEALRASEERFRSLVQNSSDMIALLDKRGTVLYESPAHERFLGHTPAERVGKQAMDLVHPDDLDRARSLLGRLLENPNEAVSGEFRLRHADGSWRVVACTGTNLLDNPAVQGLVINSHDITHRHHAEQAIRESEALYRGLFEGVPMGLYRISRDGRMVDANLNLVRLLGYPDRESLLGTSTTDLYFHDEDRRQWQLLMESQGSVRDFECQIRRHDGGVIWVRSSANSIRDASGRISHYEGAVEDITERKEAVEALRQKEERFQSLVQHAPDMIAILDGAGNILYESPAYERVLGRAPAQRIGRSAFDFLHPDDLGNVKAALEELVREPGKTLTVEHRARHTDGSWRILEATATNLLENAAVKGVVVNSRDVTERKRAIDQLLHGALYDPLTGLPNRALLIDRLERAVTASRQRPHRNFAILFLDLDQFKIINDSLGHTIGDRLLVQIGLALKTVLRPVDTIARLGGDEFVMLLDDVREEQHAIRVAERVHEILKTPFHIGGHEIFTTTSIGVAFSRPNLAGPEDLLRDADTAMYRAKAQGRACHVVFDPAMHETALNWLRLETDLRRAVNNHEFSVLYQPIISLPDRGLVGFEALVRWNHPERGLIPPAEFLPVAEETGLIVPLGRFVLERTCRHFHEWAAGCSSVDPLIVSVNLSNRQFFHADLPGDLDRILEEAEMDPRCLALEITEGVLVQDAELAARRFEQLKQMRLQLFLDDFGTGYSSLSYLHRFPIDTLKIDRSFIAHLNRGTENREIVHAILTLGASLGVRVVAEGVETSEQAEELTRLGCRLCQGYLFSRPVGPDQAAGLVRERQAAREMG